MDGVLKLEKLIISRDTGKWCQLPYNGHPRGCPNYGKKGNCPPQSPFILDILNNKKPKYFIYSEFDLSSHIRSIKKIHPDWTSRQLACVLYWQPKSRKQLRQRIEAFRKEYRCDLILTCPEACGVNVFATAARSGLKLDPTNNIKICRHIALAGYRIN